MKIYSLILGALQAFTAIGAIPAGILYLSDISGKAMGVNTEMLAGSPLHSYLLPGLFLLLINGIANAVAAYLSFSRNKYSGHTGITLGIILCLWILVQMKWITLSSFLQPLFLMVGIIEVFLGLMILKYNMKSTH